LADTDDPAEAAARLEEALERIAALSERAGRPATTTAGAVGGAAVAERLDALIAKLRTALAHRPG
jgi:hypothetical protein